jgi:hypothetical protein
MTRPLKFRHKPNEIEAEVLLDVEIILTDHGEVVGLPGQVKIKNGPGGRPYKTHLSTFLDSYEPSDEYTARELRKILEEL